MGRRHQLLALILLAALPALGQVVTRDTANLCTSNWTQQVSQPWYVRIYAVQGFTPYDLTGRRVTFSVRHDDTLALIASSTGTIHNANPAEVILRWTPSTAGSYLLNAQIMDASGTNAIAPLMADTMTVTSAPASCPDVTVTIGAGWSNLASEGSGNVVTGAAPSGTTLTLQRGNVSGGSGYTNLTSSGSGNVVTGLVEAAGGIEYQRGDVSGGSGGGIVSNVTPGAIGSWSAATGVLGIDTNANLREGAATINLQPLTNGAAISIAAGGDVSAAGANSFTGVNTFAINDGRVEFNPTNRFFSTTNATLVVYGNCNGAALAFATNGANGAGGVLSGRAGGVDGSSSSMIGLSAFHRLGALPYNQWVALRHQYEVTTYDEFGLRVGHYLGTPYLSIDWIDGSATPNAIVDVSGTRMLMVYTYSGVPTFSLNPSLNNYDFRFNGDATNGLIMGDASADAVGIGTTTPRNKSLDVAIEANFQQRVWLSTNEYLTGSKTGSIWMVSVNPPRTNSL